MIDVAALTPAFLKAWGEDIYFIPDADGTSTTVGTGRAIKAVIDRNPAGILGESGRELRGVFLVYVANAATGGYPGILGSELNCGRDVLVFERVIGKGLERVRINRIVNQDVGMLALECR